MTDFTYFPKAVTGNLAGRIFPACCPNGNGGEDFGFFSVGPLPRHIAGKARTRVASYLKSIGGEPASGINIIHTPEGYFVTCEGAGVHAYFVAPDGMEVEREALEAVIIEMITEGLELVFEG